MIRLLLLVLFVVPCIVWCQELPAEGVLAEARQEPAARSHSEQPAVGWWNLLQMGLAVTAVALGVRWVLPKVLKTKLSVGHSQEARLRVLETQSAGPATLHVVEAEGRRFLIAVTPSCVELLTELVEQEKACFEGLLESAEGTDLRDRVSAAAARLERLISDR